VRLGVSFLTNPSSELRARVLRHLNAWSKTSDVLFEEAKWPHIGLVRIALEPGGLEPLGLEPGGHWTYMGTDILLLDQEKPTTYLDGLSLSTPEPEFARVVRHLAGHLLGFGDEHLPQAVIDRIDRPQAYAHLAATRGWTPPVVDALLFTPLEQHSRLAPPPEHASIMSYQLPGHLMRDGQAYLGGADILPSDYQFAGRVYPVRPFMNSL